MGNIRLVALFAAMCVVCSAQIPVSAHSPSRYNVLWTTRGKNEMDSMPIGNGDIAANVWTESNGDLILLLGKNDAWTETGRLNKLGRVRLHFTPSFFPDDKYFSQLLDVSTGQIVCTHGDDTVKVWIDAKAPIVHVEVQSHAPVDMSASLEPWRQMVQALGKTLDNHDPVADSPDVLVDSADAVEWVHFNQSSIFPSILKDQHLAAILTDKNDPLMHRAFGARMSGPNLQRMNRLLIVSRSPQRSFRLDIVALTQDRSESVESWHSGILNLATTLAKKDLKSSWKEHVAWWNAFWDRSWLDVSGDKDAEVVSQGYAIQRYMMASSSRGEFPTKFNGGLFTVGHNMPVGSRVTEAEHDPDFRKWGEAYWNQNNRLLYWPLLTTGDFDLIQPWFKMYLNALDLATKRTRIYYQHDGASFPETMDFWGLPKPGDFGKNNPSHTIQSRWQRYHVQGSLEVIAQMLDYVDDSGDQIFATRDLIPFSDAVVSWYDQHFPRDSGGKVMIAPAQSLETYQLVAVNPAPDLAGLRADLARLVELPSAQSDPSRLERWKKMLQDLPELPAGRTTSKGKTPPFGQGDPDGIPVLLPASEYGKTSNAENPELYAVYPYHLYGVGKQNLQLARNTFAARRFPQNTCWGQDGPQGADLGLADVARKAAVAEFSNYGDERFIWFWRAGHDWIPDLDNGGTGMITLQQMLLQSSGRQIFIAPAWPETWTADFKLHASMQTTVQGRVVSGRLVRLEVTPRERERDIVFVGSKPTPQ